MSDTSSQNFSGMSFAGPGGVSSLVNNVYFADTDASGNAVATSSVTVAPGGVSVGNVYFQNRTVPYTVSSSDVNGISGSTAVYLTGGGSLTLLGIHDYAGATTIGAGSTLIIGNGATDGSIANSVIQNNGALVFSPATTATYGNAISGTGTLTASGPGTLVLTTSSSYAAPHRQRRHAATGRRDSRPRRLAEHRWHHGHQCHARLQPGRQPDRELSHYGASCTLSSPAAACWSSIIRPPTSAP